VKDGKIGRKDGQPLPGEDEPLHAYVTANNPENVLKAVEKVWKFVFALSFIGVYGKVTSSKQEILYESYLCH